MQTCILTVVILGVACATAAGRGVVWMEAERFDDRGGWTADAQFIDQMGSPYLMAIGLGTPVKDAATTVTVPEAGRYRLWARTKDWAPEHHPGRFQIVVAGTPSPVTFGGSGKKGWQWEDGGVRDLAGSLHEPTTGRTKERRRFIALRGGAWEAEDEYEFRTDVRLGFPPEARSRRIGIRLVADLDRVAEPPEDGE